MRRKEIAGTYIVEGITEPCSIWAGLVFDLFSTFGPGAGCGRNPHASRGAEADDVI